MTEVHPQRDSRSGAKLAYLNARPKPVNVRATIDKDSG